MYKSYKEDKGLFLERCIELLTWPFSKKSAFRGGLSLRRYLVEDLKYLDCAGGDSVRALRLGR
jgi:hypothetical protein